MEAFLEQFVSCSGGVIAEVEPQVHDLLLPGMLQPMRLAVDPEALPEHPGAQLLTFGSPVLDDFLDRARSGGKVVTAYLQDVNLAPYGLEDRLRKEFTVPEGVSLHSDTSLARHVTHSLFWFKVTYLSDSKEEALFAAGLDRYYGRRVKYLVDLANSGRLVDLRTLPLPDTKAIPVEHAYRIARNRLMRTLSTDANMRNGELQIRLSSKKERLQTYFADLREELEERKAKLLAKGEDAVVLEGRGAAIRREESLRLEEIEREGILRAELRLVNVLHIKVPRLFMQVRMCAEPRAHLRGAYAITMTWDPLTEHCDAAECPNCTASTYEFSVIRKGELGCPNCQASKGGTRGRSEPF